MVGVDIDDTLVRAAWKHRRSVWSQQGPDAAGSHEPQSSDSDNDRKRRRLSDSEDDAGSGSRGVPDYFPASCEHMFGALPIPAADPHEKVVDVFPHNVAFRAADWVNNEIPDDAEGYDVVIA